MGNEARINARIRMKRNIAAQPLFDAVVNRIARNNPGFNGEVFSSAEPFLGLYDDRKLDVFVRELCMMGRVVKILHATYVVNDSGDLENRHLCAIHTSDMPQIKHKEERKRLYAYRPYRDRRSCQLYALLGKVKPMLTDDGMISLIHSGPAVYLPEERRLINE
ncbi:MAG: hypothetical protein M0003_13200 [Acidithiobacillus sp.]|nr:hypothetical protein [Acidithiobacillus sp.]